MKLLFFDLETTGLDPKKNGIHRIAAHLVITDSPGVEPRDFDMTVRPFTSDYIEDAALKIGGVTQEDVMHYTPAPVVHKFFTEQLAHYCDKFDRSDKIFLVGYNNAGFDNQFLREWFTKCDDKYFGSWFWSNTIDVMVLASHYLMDVRHTMKDFKLASVAAKVGLIVQEARLHDPTYDLELTREIYRIVTQPKKPINYLVDEFQLPDGQ